MNNRLITILIASGISIFFGTRTSAQKLEDLQRSYPGEKAVMLVKSLEYNIQLKDGMPYVESQENRQTEFLSSDANSYLNGSGFSHSDFQKLGQYEAYTTTPNGEKLKVKEFKTVTDKESFVFYDDVKEKTFNFPSVEAGAIGNLKVSWNNTDPHLLSPFYFTSYLPIIKSELKLTVANDVSVKYILAGLDTSGINVKIENKHHSTIFTFTVNNCTADKRYENAPGYAWYSPHVIFYIQSYKDQHGTVISYLSDCKDLYKLSRGYLDTVNKKMSPALAQVVDSLVHGKSNNEEKARSIYGWVQHNIKYVAFEDGMGGFVPRDASLVYNRRFGDCKDMASILTAMLTRANVPAYFTWIGTRELPYDFDHVPLPITSDHMICTINLDGKYIFLDGTDPTCVFGWPSAGTQDKQAMIAIGENEYKLLTVPTIDKNSNVLVDTTLLELTPTGLQGKVIRNYKGYFATTMHGKLMYWENKDMDEYMRDEFARGSNKFHLDSFKIGNQTNPGEVKVSATFTLPDYGKKIGNEFYLNLNLLKEFQNDDFDYPNRKIPVAYDYKSVRKYVTLFKIPDGYKLTYLPEGKSYTDKHSGFSVSYEQKNGWVTLTQEFDNDRLMLKSDEFESWHKLLATLFPLYKESLSIAKN